MVAFCCFVEGSSREISRRQRPSRQQLGTKTPCDHCKTAACLTPTTCPLTLAAHAAVEFGVPAHGIVRRRVLSRPPPSLVLQERPLKKEVEVSYLGCSCFLGDVLYLFWQIPLSDWSQAQAHAVARSMPENVTRLVFVRLVVFILIMVMASLPVPVANGLLSFFATRCIGIVSAHFSSVFLVLMQL